MLSGQVSNSHFSLVHWLKRNYVYHQNFVVVFNFQSKVTFADEHNEWTAFWIWTLSLAITGTTGSNHPTAFSEAVSQKSSSYCFGNRCLQFLLGFWLFLGKAIIEIMAEEFIQWLSSLLARGRCFTHLVGIRQPEMGHLEGSGSLNQKRTSWHINIWKLPRWLRQPSSHEYLE